MADKTITDEYFDLINRECYAPNLIGRKLTQTEVDRVVAICDGYDEGNWCEEHLIEALEQFKNTL
jgi:hypothetical protein